MFHSEACIQVTESKIKVQINLIKTRSSGESNNIKDVKPKAKSLTILHLATLNTRNKELIQNQKNKPL